MESIRRIWRQGCSDVQEAIRHAHTAFTELKVPEHVKKLMEDDKCSNLTASSSDFWVALAALKRFVVRLRPLAAM